MKFFAAIATLLFATLAAAQTPAFTDCATGPTDFALSSFSVSQHPLCINQNFCFTAVGQLAAPITQGANITLYGRYLGRVLYLENHDLCALSAAQGNPCPVPAAVSSTSSVTACILAKPTPLV
ncbi:hypothetical protein BGX34_004571, partial [Mortierella sp. NVP85]